MNREITSEEVEKAMAGFCPFGYRDIAVALEVIYEAEGEEYLNVDKLADIVYEYMEETGVKLEKIDPVAQIYEHYQQIARTEIEQATGKDISNDNPYSRVVVYGNYMATTFDANEEESKATRELIDTMEEKSKVVEWYYNQLEY